MKNMRFFSGKLVAQYQLLIHKKEKMKDNQPKYKISEAAKILGISVHTMRMYEREGLIIPLKNPPIKDFIPKKIWSDYDVFVTQLMKKKLVLKE